MSVQPIIQSLEKLIDIHQSMLVISKDKTERIKEGSVEKLQQVLVKEKKYIRFLEQEEEKRQLEVEKWANEHGIPLEEVTMMYLLEKMKDGAEKEELSEKSQELLKAISQLKQQETLNHSLLSQSMQFVKVSLDLMNPSITNMNYGCQNKEGKSYNRSLFDSQA